MPNEETIKYLNDIKELIKLLDSLCDNMYDRGCLDLSNVYDREVCDYKERKTRCADVHVVVISRYGVIVRCDEGKRNAVA